MQRPKLHGCRVRLGTLVLTASILNAGSIATHAQELNGSGSRHYPVQTDTAQWKALSLAEQRTVSDLPADLCSKLTTPDLLQACLDYPFLIELHVTSDGITGGLKLVSGRCTQLAELQKRPDVGLVLLAKYKAYSELPKAKLTGKTVMEHALIFALLAQDTILDHLTPAERGELGIAALRALANQRTAMGSCASEGDHVRILAKLVISKQTKVSLGGETVSIEDLGGPAASYILRSGDFCPERDVLDRLVAIGNKG